jgi:ATP-dependent Clp protease ATP-binding subunit ClpA
MDNNFSAQVKEIISYSREEALRLGNDFIGTEHLVLGLIREGENTAVKILKSLNIDLYELRKEIEMAVKDKSGKNIANINSLPLTKQAEKVIRITVLEAKSLKSALVETEHLMLSILKNKENIATQILNQFEVDYDIFKTDLGFVTSKPPQADFNEEEEDVIGCRHTGRFYVEGGMNNVSHEQSEYDRRDDREECAEENREVFGTIRRGVDGSIFVTSQFLEYQSRGSHLCFLSLISIS